MLSFRYATALRICNARCFVDAEIPLHPGLTVIIGWSPPSSHPCSAAPWTCVDTWKASSSKIEPHVTSGSGGVVEDALWSAVIDPT